MTERKEGISLDLHFMDPIKWINIEKRREKMYIWYKLKLLQTFSECPGFFNFPSVS